MTSKLRHLAIALVVMAVYGAGGLDLIEHRLMDLRFRLMSKPADAGVVVVAIDPASLRRLDTWPWPRGYHASVIENLLDAGARGVAFDIDFSSPSLEEEDAALEAALEQAGGRVILPAFRQWQEDPGGLRLLTTVPLATLGQHATLASINVQPDVDGLVRRYRANDVIEGMPVPSLAVALQADGRGEAAGPSTPDEFYIDFALDKETVPYLSYVDVLTGQFDRGIVAGRAVIVGATAVELGDQVAVPLHTTVPGPILQALSCASLSSGRALQRSSWPLGLILALGIAWLLGPRVENAPWRRGFFWLALVALGLFSISLAAQRFLPVLLDISPMGITLAGSYTFGLVRRIERQNLRLLVQTLRAQKSELRMRHVVEHSFDAIVTVGEDGRIESFNPAAEAMFRSVSGEAIGRSIDDLIPEGLNPPPGGRRATPREGTGRRADGTTFPLDLADTISSPEGRYLRVIFLRDITQRRAQQRALEHQATHDALTGLPNRTMLQRRVGDVLEEARRERTAVAFLILDLDRFKEVNDTLGHHVGDVLLQKIAERLRNSVPGGQTIGRLGGDEFAIVLSAVHPREAQETAGRLIRTLSDPFELEGLTLQVDVSIGIAVYPDHGEEAATLLQRADVAMYMAKRLRNTSALYNPEEDFNSVRHLTLKGELRRAVEEDHLVLFYQPQISTRTGRVVGVEALVRWQHPDLGLLSPVDFIPMAEHTGLIKPITEWVLDRALAQCAAWRKEGLVLPVSVNCSARNLLDQDLPRMVRERLDLYRLGADCLILEITETAIIEDPPLALEVLSVLADLGVRISIDDFGTGYSSLEYLRKLPARELKIDKSFLLGMEQDEGNAVIVRSTVDLAHNLGLEAVAEGVDSPVVWERVRALGCDRAQGFLFSRPASAEDLLVWIRTSAWGLPAAQKMER